MVCADYFSTVDGNLHWMFCSLFHIYFSFTFKSRVEEDGVQETWWVYVKTISEGFYVKKLYLGILRSSSGFLRDFQIRNIATVCLSGILLI